MTSPQAKTLLFKSRTKMAYLVDPGGWCDRWECNAFLCSNNSSERPLSPGLGVQKRGQTCQQLSGQSVVI